MKKWLRLCVCLFLVIPFMVCGQKRVQDNNIYLQINIHLEKGGKEKYSTSNPDYVQSFERKILSLGNNHLLIGVRSGLYQEYVLTGQGWDHPEKKRFFIGMSPSYAIDIHRKVRIQINGIWDILLPDDYDEQWWYFAIEPSFNFYFTKHLYGAISAAMGVYPGFEPKAYMDKAGLKLGFSF